MSPDVAATNMLMLVEKAGKLADSQYPGVRSEDGKGLPHAIWMLRSVQDEEVQGEKAHRWLAWAQCILAYEGVCSLTDCKYGNLFS